LYAKTQNTGKIQKTRKGKIPKIGEMATFLARDIVDMIISKEKKKKITSFYYDKMQECLALYADPEKKEMFIQIITNELGLFENNGHPFLNEINFKQLRYTQLGKCQCNNFDSQIGSAALAMMQYI